MTTEPKTGATTTAAAETGAPSSIFDKFSMVWCSIFLAIALAMLFHKSFDKQWVHFSNDGPLGICAAEENSLPSQFFGSWADLNWMGNESIAAVPSFTGLLRWLITPQWYANFLPPTTLFFVGMCAFYCFRKLKLSPMACILGGLAAGLNSDFFSTSCWGVASQTVGFGGMFLAVGWTYAAGKSTRSWLMVIAAGAAVGLGIMEAYDIGAIFSLFVAAFVMYRWLFMADGPIGARLGNGVVRVALVAIVAAIISASALSGLIGTQVLGVASAQQNADTKAKTWPGATEWSLPKVETLQVIIPGIFGYRNQWHMYDNDQPHTNQYWGRIGEQPVLDEARAQLDNPNPEVRAQAKDLLSNPNVLRRLIGTGFYSGISVVVIALWTVFQSFRKQGSPFTRMQTLAIRFFFGVTVLSLLMSYGKYAPFYQMFYALPYASAIRNPDKFMHVFQWALIILFAYGLHGLIITYLYNHTARAKLASFDRKWLIGSGAVIVLSVIGWVIYAKMTPDLISYLQTTGIPLADVEPVAHFSVASVFWYLLFLSLITAVLGLIFKGRLSGSRAGLAAVLIGAVVVLDSVHADTPWNTYWDINYKYSADPVIKLLANEPWEHRVAYLPPFRDWTEYQSTQQYGLLNNAYGSNWKQHLFPYFNIQCADDIQEPRPGEDKQRFMAGMPLFRFWELSNTRYLLAPGGDFTQKLLDPTGTHFRVLTNFDFRPKAGVLQPQSMVDFEAIPNPDGKLAVVEYLSTLPRAQLFTDWQVNDDDDTVLRTLASQNFDPRKTVFVASTNMASPAAANTNLAGGTVQITHYKSKRVELSAEVKVPSVLYLADRYNPKWHVSVDGKEATLLRCDFIARGVQLEPGKHQVVFYYKSPLHTTYISLASIVLSLLLICYLAFTNDREEPVVVTKVK